MHRITWQIILALSLALVIRFGLSLTIYNNDVHNHIAWMESVSNSGWQGIYERDVSPWASVNYPPISLYTFWASEQIYQQLSQSLATMPVHAALYKLPSILADCLIALLIWVFSPASKKWRAIMMAIFLFNPALIINSVFWGQIESLSALFTILAVLALIHRQSGWAILSATITLLIKQNFLPLIPLFFMSIFLLKSSLLKTISSLLASLALVILAYAIVVPPGQSLLPYAFSSYVSSIGGQIHQHLSSVNALNIWYTLGLNQVSDSPYRTFSLLALMVGVYLGLKWLYRLRANPYLSYWVAVYLTSIWTFVFSTRMHERHSYMAIAYLTFLIPYSPALRWLYIVLSVISFYNTYAVWMEYFATGMSAGWSTSMIFISLVTTLTALYSAYLPSQFLHQNRIKPQVMDRGEAENSLIFRSPHGRKLRSA